MVLVGVGDDERFDIVEPVLDVTQVRQDQVDPGFVVSREEHTAIHDEQFAQMLEDRHVAADFADSAQRGNSQTAGGQWLGGREFGAH